SHRPFRGVDRRAFTRTMRILESRYPVQDWSRGMTPFEILISTILCQSTTVANERRGLNDLRAKVGASTPQRLADAPDREIAKAIWYAGLATQKAPRIRGVARALDDEGGNRLERILALPTKPAREKLMALPGVGPKTADVVLAMAAGHPTFPVDTHIARIARRWNRGRRVYCDERGRGGRVAVRPPDARGSPGGRGRERDEPLSGPRPRLGHASDPEPTVASAPNRAAGPRPRVWRRIAHPEPRHRGARHQPLDGRDDRPRLCRLHWRLHGRTQA